MEEPTTLELAVAAMFSTYMSYQGPDNKLNKEQFLNLLKNELPLFCEAKSEDEIFKCVDQNDDKCVDFEEFASLVAGCACASHDALEKVMKEMEEKKQSVNVSNSADGK